MRIDQQRSWMGMAGGWRRGALLGLVTAALLVAGCRNFAPYSEAPDKKDGGGDLPPRDAPALDRAPGPEGGPAADLPHDLAPLGDGSAFHDMSPPDPCGRAAGVLYVAPAASCKGRWRWHSPAAGGMSIWPYPRNTIRGAWAFSAQDAWLVGDAGTVLRRTSGGWETLYVGGEVDLLAVWGASSGDVWIGGSRGTLVRVSGSAQNKVARAAVLPFLKPGAVTVRSIWGRSANDVWAATSSGLIHFDGTRWRLDAEATKEKIVPLAVSGLTGDVEIFVVDEGNDLWTLDAQGRWAHTSFSNQHPTTFTNVAEGVAVGKGGSLALYHGAKRSWISVQSTIAADLTTVTRDPTAGTGTTVYYIAGGTTAWLLGTSSQRSSFTVSSATYQPSTAGAAIHAIAAWAATKATVLRAAIFCGDGGTCDRPRQDPTDGVSAQILNPQTRYDFRRLSRRLDGSFLATAAGQKRVFTVAGGEYQTLTFNAPINAAWGASPLQLWAGDAFALRYHDGTNILDVPPNAMTVISDVWGHRDANNDLRIFAVGNGSVWQGKAGSAPFVLQSPTSQQRVFGAEGGKIYTMGPGGLYYYISAGSWGFASNSKPPAGQTVVRSLWLDGGAIYAILGGSEQGGATLYTYSNGWQVVTSGGAPLPKVSAVWGKSKHDLWAVGPAGLILHYDGTGWQQAPAITRHDLSAVAGSGSAVYAAGAWNTLLRLETN